MDQALARQVADTYAAGSTQREVSEQFGIYPRLVREALRQEGVNARLPGTRLEDPNETAEWVQRHSSGEPVASIARSSGHGQYYVSRRLKLAGVELFRGPREHHRRWDSEAVEAVLERYEAGERIADIAEDEGVSANRLRFVLAKAGTPVGGSTAKHREAHRALHPKPVPLSAAPRPRRVVERDRGELLTHVRRCAAALGLSPGDRVTMTQYAAWAGENSAPTVTTLYKHLGPWSEVVAEAGFKPGQQPRRQYARLSRDQALEAVHAYVVHCDRAGAHPTGDGYRAWSRGRGLPSHSGLLLHWRWKELVEAAQGRPG